MFYEQFQFPGNRPIDQDGLIFMRRFTKSIESRSRGGDGMKLRVLDAGCGTGNTSIALSRRFHQVELFGLDNSRASLKKATSSARQCGLTNLHFRQWNLMNPLPYKRQFDIILCLGVLHHTANMKEGLSNLHTLLKDEGELYLWIYGKHGRYKHSLNMRLLDMLRRTKPKISNAVALAKEFVLNADNGSALNDLLGKTKTDMIQRKTLDDPVWIADQFLNPHEVLIDMVELMAMVNTSGFIMEHVLGMEFDAAKHFNSPLLLKRFQKLNKDQQLIALDLLLKPDRYFVVLCKSVTKKLKDYVHVRV
jgi:SAM-dependent methyltransferase